LTSRARVDLLGMGISPVDFFISAEGYPEAGRKITGVPQSSLIAGGGPIPNAACTFAGLGGSAAVICCFGDDSWGRFAIREMDRFGVDHHHCIFRKKSSSALASAWINIADGDRTIILDMPSRMYIRPRDVVLSRLPQPKLIEIDGRHIEADMKLARWGRKAGVRVMLDVGSVRNPVDRLFPYIDILVCADDYARHYFRTGSIVTAVRGFSDMGIGEVVVTEGINGSFGIDNKGREIRQRAYKVRSVDATGAGDVYHGAYLYGLHREWDMARRMKFASAAAALKCRKPGARLGIPTLRQTLRFMKNHRAYYA